VLALKTDFALHFSSRGAGAPPRHPSYATDWVDCFVNPIVGWSSSQKKTSNNDICQPVYIQHAGFWTFLVQYALISSFILILVESDQYWYSYRKVRNRSNSIFQKENSSIFQLSENGPTIITLLPNHHIDFRGDSEYQLQVAVKFSLVRFRRERSQITPTVLCYFYQNCLETSIHGLPKSIVKPLFRRQKIWQSFITCFIIWLVP